MSEKQSDKSDSSQNAIHFILSLFSDRRGQEEYLGFLPYIDNIWNALLISDWLVKGTTF